MTENLNLRWAPPGPVASAFMASTAMSQIINGPVGSGKTTAAMVKAAMIAQRQMPSPRRRMTIAGATRPVRMVKMAAIRETYRQLWRSTLASWFKRFPREVGVFTGADNGPAVHTIPLILNDGTVVEFIAEFGAIGDNNVEEFMRGYEPTFFYLNELDLHRKEVYAYALDRAGRYPDVADGGATWRGVLADCNAPDFDNWLYRDEERDEGGRNKPGIFTMTPAARAAAGIDLFVQPGGRDPGAENIENLPKGYYTPKVGQTAYYVARMIDNKSGWSQAGKPVHPEFKPALHVAQNGLDPIPGIGLVIGIDPRTFPSAVFLQRLANGQRRIIGEMQGEQNMGARRFGKQLADYLHDHFPFLSGRQIRGMVDPSAFYGADTEAGEQNWVEIVSELAGITIEGAPSNNIDMRREALKKPLSELIDGEPAIFISADCSMLITGLSSGFRYRKMNVPGGARFSDEVEKNSYADLCEAAEYACLSDGAEIEIMGRKADDAAQLAAMSATGQHEWDPFGGSS